MEIINVIKELYHYRKNHNFKNAKRFRIVFFVDKKANKVMIKKAFNSIFGVNPNKVNTQNRHPQPARIMPKSKKNFTKAKKLAFVYLTKEDFKKLKELFEMELMQEEIQPIKETEKKQTSEIKDEKIIENVKKTKKNKETKSVKKVEENKLGTKLKSKKSKENDESKK